MFAQKVAISTIVYNCCTTLKFAHCNQRKKRQFAIEPAADPGIGKKKDATLV